MQKSDLGSGDGGLFDERLKTVSISLRERERERMELGENFCIKWSAYHLHFCNRPIDLRIISVHVDK